MARLFKDLGLQKAVENAIPFTEVSPNSTGVFTKVLRFGLTYIVFAPRHRASLIF